MDESIEICSGCGKMPRMSDKLTGSFTCSRCGGTQTLLVNADNYEKIASELDQRFHSGLMRKNLEAASKEPIKLKPRKAKAKKSKVKGVKSKKK